MDKRTPCSQCPRKCGSKQNALNYCGKPGNGALIPFVKGMLHFWEEPCISGVLGSGAMFFSGCNLGCSFCQNQEISRPNGIMQRQISPDQLEAEMFLLKRKGCHNINLVTGSHLTDALIPVLRHAIANNLDLPIIWNSSAYEAVIQVKRLEPLIDVYLPDLKFFSPELSGKIAHAPDYFQVAGKAVLEMVWQKPENRYDSLSDTETLGIFKYDDKVLYNNTTRCNDNIDNNQNIINGVIIRHLVLPGFYKDSIKILEWIEANLSNHITLSLMSQYIPDYYSSGCCAGEEAQIPSLRRKLTTLEYERVVDKAISLGFKDVFIQKRESAKAEFVPDFTF